MLLLCFCYAFAMILLCFCYAFAMPLLFFTVIIKKSGVLMINANKILYTISGIFFSNK